MRSQTSEPDVAAGSTPVSGPTPAEQLAGRTLATGWVVAEILNVQRDSTGGYFSTCYLVEKNGQKAFLKALDYWRAFRKGGNPAQILQEMTEAYNFECDILRRCGGGGFDRVVTLRLNGIVAGSAATCISLAVLWRSSLVGTAQPIY